MPAKVPLSLILLVSVSLGCSQNAEGAGVSVKLHRILRRLLQASTALRLHITITSTDCRVSTGMPYTHEVLLFHFVFLPFLFSSGFDSLQGDEKYCHSRLYVMNDVHCSESRACLLPP